MRTKLKKALILSAVFAAGDALAIDRANRQILRNQALHQEDLRDAHHRGFEAGWQAVLNQTTTMKEKLESLGFTVKYPKQ